MSILLSVHELRKSFAARPLFDGLTFSIESGERIGLIGPNGAGKSTLLRILAGQASPDNGTLSLQRGLRVSFLEQSPSFGDDQTIMEAVLSGAQDPHDWEAMGDAHEYISRLGLDTPDKGAECLVSKLSGGWKKRVALARELVKKPDLLLLDEPTNHLDVEGILWLEEFMQNAPFATLTVTHDRAFLQRISNRILELDRRNAGGILSVQGDYAAYLEVKEQLLSTQVKREVILKNTLRRETEWLRRGAKARTTKQQARIQRHGELASDVGELEVRNQTRTARIQFQSTDRAPKKLIEAKKISKTFGSRSLFSNLDLLLMPGTRIGLLGTNGCGKSTLIRVLVGEIATDTGDVLRSDLLKVAYFEQNRESLDPTKTLSKTLCPVGDFVDFRGGRTHIRSYLDRFLFTPEQMEMAVGKLSGGEQSRILLAKLMLQEANLLILDEPTNDLDMATLSVLEDCLIDFPGAILLVTHDRYFLDQVATQLLAFEDGKTTTFVGLEQWETWKLNEAAEARAKLKPAAKAAAAAKAEKKRKLSFNEQREFDSMESNIQKAEIEIVRLSEQSSLPENLANSKKLTEINQALVNQQTELDRLFSRWTELGG